MSPDDLRDPPQYDPSESEESLVKWVMESFEQAAMARMPVERDWVLGLAMEEGRQWLGWDDKTHRAIDLQVKGELERYVTDPLIRPLVTKHTALVTMTRPDATPAPDTEGSMDQAAAEEARAIMSHCDRLFARQLQTVERVRWATICGCSFLKVYWNPNESATVPEFGPDGTVTAKRSLPVGEVCEEVIPPFEIFLDPNAKRWNDTQWVIHATVRPLSWFQERYGERGYMVKGDQDERMIGYVDSYLRAGPDTLWNGIRSSFGFNRLGKERKAAIAYEMWVRPTPKYPQGRYICVGGGVLLHNGPWPANRKATQQNPFPFVRLVYQESAWHPYGRGLVADLAPLQVAYNRLISRILERVDDDRQTLLMEKGAGVGADAYDIDTEDRNVRKVYYNRGSKPPVYQQAPPVSRDVYQLREICWQDMQHIAGIHDVNMGGTPGGVTAGISIELLQQGDRTQMGLFLIGIEQSAVEIGEWEIALYAQYASPYLPRMMGLDSSGNAQTALFAAQAFRALTAGGSCSVIVSPGSATPKTAAGQNQEILEYFKLGLFDPQNPGAEIAIRLLSMARSNEVLTALRRAREEAQAAGPDPAQIEAMKQQGAVAMQRQALEAQAATTAIKTDSEIKKAQARHELDMEKILTEKLAEARFKQRGVMTGG